MCKIETFNKKEAFMSKVKEGIRFVVAAILGSVVYAWWVVALVITAACCLLLFAGETALVLIHKPTADMFVGYMTEDENRLLKVLKAELGLR